MHLVGSKHSLRTTRIKYFQPSVLILGQVQRQLWIDCGLARAQLARIGFLQTLHTCIWSDDSKEHTGILPIQTTTQLHGLQERKCKDLWQSFYDD